MEVENEKATYLLLPVEVFVGIYTWERIKRQCIKTWLRSFGCRELSYAGFHRQLGRDWASPTSLLFCLPLHPFQLYVSVHLTLLRTSLPNAIIQISSRPASGLPPNHIIIETQGSKESISYGGQMFIALWYIAQLQTRGLHDSLVTIESGVEERRGEERKLRNNTKKYNIIFGCIARGMINTQTSARSSTTLEPGVLGTPEKDLWGY